MSARGQYHRLRSELQSTFDRFETIPVNQIETRSHFARYLLIRLAGSLEYTLEAVATAYIEDNSGGPVRSFALSFSGYTGNLDSERLLQFVDRFDPQWRTELEVFLAIGERKNSLNSLNGIRGAVAHGKPSSVSIVSVLGYLKVVDDFFEWFLGKVEPL